MDAAFHADYCFYPKGHQKDPTSLTNRKWLVPVEHGLRLTLNRGPFQLPFFFYLSLFPLTPIPQKESGVGDMIRCTFFLFID